MQTPTTQVGMFYKDYHSSLDQFQGGDGEGGYQVLSALPSGVPTLIKPTPLSDKDIDEIPKLFNMPGVTEDVLQYWRNFMENQITPEPVSENYFNCPLLRYRNQRPHNFNIELPPSGFEVEPGAGYMSDSSPVSKIINLLYYCDIFCIKLHSIIIKYNSNKFFEYVYTSSNMKYLQIYY